MSLPQIFSEPLLLLFSDITSQNVSFCYIFIFCLILPCAFATHWGSTTPSVILPYMHQSLRFCSSIVYSLICFVIYVDHFLSLRIMSNIDPSTDFCAFVIFFLTRCIYNICMVLNNFKHHFVNNTLKVSSYAILTMAHLVL